MKKTLIFTLVVVSSLLIKMSFGQMQPADGSKMNMSKYNFSETVDILKGAIENENLMIIFEIDGQKMLRMAGKEVNGMKQLFYFHPRYMKRVIEANKEAGIQIPLKLIVMEKPDNKVVIRYFLPSTILNKYDGETEISAELDEIVKRIISETTK